VSPVVVVPYTYDEDELWFQARNVVSMVVNNASFNCNAAKLLVTSRSWGQREQFLCMVEDALARVPTRPAYYPGAFERYEKLVGGREQVARFGRGDDRSLPWAFIRGVDAGDEADPVFRTEPFCSVLSETCVGSADPVEFLASVTEFLDQRVWGTLNATLIVHPRLESDDTVGKALERAVVELRYGTVGINVWPAVGYASAVMPWGGHQSASLRRIESGLGWVHNTFMLREIDKSVIRGPIRMRPHPVWFYDHKRPHEVGPRMAAMEAEPRWRKLPGLVLKAI
jgi:aldehyde dehydrogenase (NAD(P)+)